MPVVHGVAFAVKKRLGSSLVWNLLGPDVGRVKQAVVSVGAESRIALSGRHDRQQQTPGELQL